MVKNCPAVQKPPVPSLVWELRSHMPGGNRAQEPQLLSLHKARKVPPDARKIPPDARKILRNLLVWTATLHHTFPCSSCLSFPSFSIFLVPTWKISMFTHCSVSSFFCLFVCLFVFAIALCHAESWSQNQESNLCPLQWEHVVLTNGPSGKALAFSWMTDLEAHFLHHCFLLKCVNNEQVPMVQKQNNRVGAAGKDPPAHLEVFMKCVLTFSPSLRKGAHHLWVLCCKKDPVCHN